MIGQQGNLYKSAMIIIFRQALTSQLPLWHFSGRNNPLLFKNNDWCQPEFLLKRLQSHFAGLPADHPGELGYQPSPIVMIKRIE